MARGPQRPVPTRAILNSDELKQGISRLEKRLQELRSFDPQAVDRQFNYAPLKKLEASIDDALVRTFGEHSVEYGRYGAAASFNTGPISMYQDTHISEVREAVAESKEKSIALLEQAKESLEEQLADMVAVPKTPPSSLISAPKTGKIIVVHGHDDAAREVVARFVEKLGFKPIILHEHANKGRTIIEKFEAHGDVDFAIILLTPDDLGQEVGGEPKPRARQNVLLELGYFFGRLGRQSVCALKKGDLELPSDFIGVVYEDLDSAGGWKQKLAREMDAAGLTVDWNRVMRP